MIRLERRAIVSAACALALLGGLAPAGSAQSPPPAVKWTAPPESKDVANPVKTDGRTVERGKKLFQTYCVACHGNAGSGDGAMGLKLGYKAANLTLENINQQTDGEIFWKISKGKAPMPSWEPQLLARDRWDLVSYVRTLIRSAPNP